MLKEITCDVCDKSEAEVGELKSSGMCEDCHDHCEHEIEDGYCSFCNEPAHEIIDFEAMYEGDR